MNTDEVWKCLAPYFPKYDVSDQGNVRRKRDHKLIKFYEVNGYNKIKLSHLGKEYYPRVNRLVLLAFRFRDDYKDYDVDHIDFDKKNNNLNNLRWMTPEKNKRRKNV